MDRILFNHLPEVTNHTLSLNRNIHWPFWTFTVLILVMGEKIQVKFVGLGNVTVLLKWRPVAASRGVWGGIFPQSETLPHFPQLEGKNCKIQPFSANYKIFAPLRNAFCSLRSPQKKKKKKKKKNILVLPLPVGQILPADRSCSAQFVNFKIHKNAYGNVVHLVLRCLQSVFLSLWTTRKKKMTTPAIGSAVWSK